jgi:hypothetical protein
LSIHAGLRDVPAIRRDLAKAAAESTPPFSIVATGCSLDEFRGDPEIDGPLFELFGR